jgi:hypothetical protein
MSQFVDGNHKTFIADEAIAVHLRVKLDSDGRVTVAGLTDKDIGKWFQTFVNRRPAFSASATTRTRPRTPAVPVVSVSMVPGTAIVAFATAFAQPQITTGTVVPVAPVANVIPNALVIEPAVETARLTVGWFCDATVAVTSITASLMPGAPLVPLE